MYKHLLTISILALLSSCATRSAEPYVKFIKDEFLYKETSRAKESKKVTIFELESTPTKEQIFDKSPQYFEPGVFDDYEIINFQLIYSGSYWLETYQVLRKCTKSNCKHEFILLMGIYS